MIMPAVMTIMTKKAGPHRMGRVMGILGVPMLVAPLLGPMPLAGKLTDRYGPTKWSACGIPLLVIGIAPMMPTMTAAMQAVPPAAIARTSTAMNIIRQSGASIGTAIRSVVLASAISDKLLAGHHPSGGGGFELVSRLTPAQHAKVAEPLAEAFAQTFVWGLALLALAFIPALAMALE
jgi:MFS family permease